MGNKKIIITESQLKMIAKHNTSKKDSNVGDNTEPINESTQKEYGPSLNDAQLLMKKVFNQLSK